LKNYSVNSLYVINWRIFGLNEEGGLGVSIHELSFLIGLWLLINL